MHIRILLVPFIALLQSCSILPGMQNINTSSMYVENNYPEIKAEPIVRRITPAYLLHHPLKPFHYRVAAQDVLSISVWNHKELDITPQNANSNLAAIPSTPGYVVNAAGDIHFPLIGRVHVGDQTIDQIRSHLTMRLSQYLRHPQLSVQVADFRSQRIYVLGEVLKPGFLPLTDKPLNIVDAIQMTGSFDPNTSDPGYIYIIRGNFTCPVIYWLNASNPAALLLGEQFRLQANDILVVSTAPVARWNRFLNQLLPTLQTVWYTKAITRGH